MANEPLNPVDPTYGIKFAENTSGIIAAIQACIAAAGGTVTSYPSNTAGVIQALLDLKTVLAVSGSAGTVELSLTAGENLTLGNLVYLSTDGKVYKATNDDTRAKATVFGMAKEAITANASGEVVIRGSCSGLSGLTTSNELYLGTAGATTATAPSASGSYVTGIGQAMSASSVDLHVEVPVLLT